MKLLLTYFLFIFLHFVSSQRDPFVILPTAIRWQSENSITVIPKDWSQIPMNIEVFIDAKENALSLSEQLFYEKRIISDLGSASIFTFNSSHQPNSIEYGIKVSVTGHKAWNSVLPGIPNVKSITIQTDKGFYRPGEMINVRILPINGFNELYASNLSISLVNSQGFNVITNVASSNSQIIRTQFQIPDFAKEGFWSIVAKPTVPSLPWMYSNMKIRVQDYSLPKFFITMSISETEEENAIKVTIHSRYFHGQPVQGSVFIACESQTQLGVGNLVEGSWEEKANISRCLKDSKNGIIRLTATVTDNDNDKNVAIREFRPRDPKFQAIPLRPFFDDSTKTVKIYFKALLADVIGDKIEIVCQCISDVAEQNGGNVSFSTSVGETAEFEIDQRCMIYIIRARRVVGTRRSDEAFLVLPSIFNVAELKLSLINPSKKVAYTVGEKFEASIPSLMNYAVICNKKDMVQQGAVTINGILEFPITRNMEGFCTLHVFGTSLNQKITQSDVGIFFVESSTCSNEYSMKSSETLFHPPANITLSAKAPIGSMAIIQGIDEKLLHLINTIQIPKSNIYWNLNAFIEPSREENALRLVNFINPMNVYQRMRTMCQRAGKRGPSNPFAAIEEVQEISDISNYCIREYNRSVFAQQAKVSTIYPLKSDSSKPRVSEGSMFALKIPEISQTSSMQRQEDAPSKLNDAAKIQNEITDELFLRTFFPEVWYFNDISFSNHAEQKIHLESPHSFGKWQFTSTFWTPEEPAVCAVKPLTIETRRHVFMEIDIPNQVFENETIIARVIVNGDNFEDEKKLAVCFTGLSPVVCADMGKNGYMAETEYTRVVLNSTQKRSEKFIYFKFLKEGPQNISFELREEVEVIGGDANHCKDNGAKKYDRILKTVEVKRRLDQRETFRQVNIYPQKQVYETAAKDVSNPLSLMEQTATIGFTQNHISEQEVETTVDLSSPKILGIFVEVSEYQPSFPLGVESQEISLFPRVRRSAEFYGLTSILMDYAYTTYDQKQGKLNGNLKDNSLEEGNKLNELQRLRSELFQFSNCSIYSDICAFGALGPPVAGLEPSILYTATITSLMCEENVEDQYVCGLLSFLSNVSNNGVENYDIDFHGQINFATKDEETWFLRAVLRQTFSDCKMRECMRSKRMIAAQKKLVETFYGFDDGKDHDIRVEAAIASVAPRILSANLRQKILQKADTSQMPYWRVPSELRQAADVDETVVKSMDITANSLALLAFVNQSAEVYDHYRSQFNLPRLAEWITDERTSKKGFQSAIDTFYAWRALYRYNERLTGPYESNNVKVQLLNAGFPMREYSNKDMPFTLQLPSDTRKFSVQTIGEGRIVLGIRVLSSPFHRKKRTNNPKEPKIEITTKQVRTSRFRNMVTQYVCIKPKLSSIKTLEIEHNLYTGFTADFSQFLLLDNTTKLGVSLIGMHHITVSGIYFAITGLQQDVPACYAMYVKEPVVSYTAEYLAPVTINAHFNQISGQALLYASDIKEALMFLRKRHSHAGRSKRDEIGNPNGISLVETVCLPSTKEESSCTCSELSCSARCLTCAKKTTQKSVKELYDELTEETKKPGKFGLLATHISSESVLYNNENYTKALMNIGYSINQHLVFGCAPNIDQFVLWIRGCNRNVCKKLGENKLYFLVGSSKGFFNNDETTTTSTNSTQILSTNYLLRDGDRLEGGIRFDEGNQNGGDDSNSVCYQLLRDLLVTRIPCV